MIWSDSNERQARETSLTSSTSLSHFGSRSAAEIDPSALLPCSHLRVLSGAFGLIRNVAIVDTEGYDNVNDLEPATLL